MSISRRLVEWLAELDAVANQPDRGDDWELTIMGKASLAVLPQRAEDLRTIIDANTLD